MNNTIIREMLPILLSSSDVSELGISKYAFYTIVNSGDVPSVAIGGRKYLNCDRFFEWLDSQSSQSNNSI